MCRLIVCLPSLAHLEGFAQNLKGMNGWNIIADEAGQTMEMASSFDVLPKDIMSRVDLCLSNLVKAAARVLIVQYILSYNVINFWTERAGVQVS